MSTIDELNSKYVENKKALEAIRKCEKNVSSIFNRSDLSVDEKAEEAIRLLDGTSKEVQYLKIKPLNDTVEIGSQYLDCVKTVMKLKKGLLEYERNGRSNILKIAAEVKKEQEEYDKRRDAFEKKYGQRIDSLDVLNDIVLRCLKKILKSIDIANKDLQNRAKELVENKLSLVLSMSDALNEVSSLPQEVVVAKMETHKATQEILADIGIRNKYENLELSFKDQGNIIVSAGFVGISDEVLDNFILAYVFRVLESFPLGCINIHIFDKNTNYLYKRLYNSFQSANAGEAIKGIVQIHQTIGDISYFRDVVCEDVFKKTSVDRPDLYSIYKTDRTDPFNLVVLRNGLLDGNGYSTTEGLEMIKSLTKPDDIGHRCGIRFLIIDCNDEVITKRASDASIMLKDSIYQNCQYIFEYKNGMFSYSGQKIQMLEIKDIDIIYTLSWLLKGTVQHGEE